MAPQTGAEIVPTDPADHCDARPGARGHYRLIAALAAALERPFCPDHSLVGPRQVGRMDHDVEVQAAADNDVERRRGHIEGLPFRTFRAWVQIWNPQDP